MVDTVMASRSGIQVEELTVPAIGHHTQDMRMPTDEKIRSIGLELARNVRRITPRVPPYMRHPNTQACTGEALIGRVRHPDLVVINIPIDSFEASPQRS